MSCCNKIADLGCVSTCSTITLPFLANVTGTHIVEVSFLNITYPIAIEATEGENFEIPTVDLNESSCITFKIKQPDCGYYVAEVDGNNYECFTIKMKVQLFINNTSPGDFSCGDFNQDFL